MPEVLPSEAIQAITDPAERLASAGARLLTDDTLGILSAGFSPEAVTGTAGRTRRVFYDHFATKEEFCRRVLLPFLDVGDHEALGEASQTVFRELVLESDGDLVDSISAFSAVFFEAANASAAPHIRAIAFAVGRNDPTLRQALAAYNSGIDSVYAGVIEQAMQAWNTKMRAPWTPQLLSTVMRGMAESFFSYNAVAPGTITHETFASIVLTIVSPILAPIDASDQRVEVGLLGTARKAKRAWRNNQSPTVVANTRKLVLDAVEPCLRKEGPARLNLETIAEAVGVTTDSLRSAFGTLTDIVEQAIKQSLPALDREITFDLSTPELTTAEVLTRHLTRLTAWSVQHPELANALRSPLGGVPIDPSAQDPDTTTSTIFQTLSTLAQRVVQDGVDRKELAHTTEPERVAPVVTYLALTPSQTPAPHTPRESARWVTSLVIDGLKNNPSDRQDPSRASND